jgi:hypothetical protein
MLRSKTGGGERKVLDGVTSRGFLPVRGGLYFLGSMEGGTGLALQYYDEAKKRSRVLARVSSRPVSGFTVSPDGKTFLYAIQNPATSDLVMIENFR